MDGQGRAMNHVFTERLWRSVEYEEVYIIRTTRLFGKARGGISKYMAFYNQERPHQSLDYRTPFEVYWNSDNKTKEVSRYLMQAKILS